MTGRSSDRRREVGLAGHRGDVAAAAAALADADPGVRATALGALARAGGLTAAHLHAALADPAPEVRRRGAEETARCVPAARDGIALVPLLDDDDAFVVEAAAFALGELDPPEPGSVAALACSSRAAARTSWCGRPRSPRSAASAIPPAVPRCWRRRTTCRRCAGGRCSPSPPSTAPTWRTRSGAWRRTATARSASAAEDLLQGWGASDCPMNMTLRRS